MRRRSRARERRLKSFRAIAAGGGDIDRRPWQLSMVTTGQPSQVIATANPSDGTKQVETAQVTWGPSDPAVATVYASRLCSALTFG